MNYDVLNEMIKYIEDHLDNEIDFNQLSKITGMNIFILERIFNFLTDMTLKEYIKKRRLSASFEEIKNSDRKIIDIAFKYQFNSSTSFNRAFKNLFGVSPSECRKEKIYQSVPMITFPIEYNSCRLDYEINQIEEKLLYCYHLSEKNHDDLLYKIRKLFKKFKSENASEKLYHDGNVYGLYLTRHLQFDYYLGTPIKNETLEVFKLSNKKYVIFKIPSKNQLDIVTIEKKIAWSWYPSTKYKADLNLVIEKYTDDYTFIMIPLD